VCATTPFVVALAGLVALARRWTDGSAFELRVAPATGAQVVTDGVADLRDVVERVRDAVPAAATGAAVLLRNPDVAGTDVFATLDCEAGNDSEITIRISAAPGAAERLAEQLERLIVDAPGCAGAIDELPRFGDDDERAILAWNTTELAVDSSRCIHERIPEVAPAAIALVASEGALTYGELQGRANRLAHRLLAMGCGPGVRVGVALDRSLDLVIALLGVMKSGAAYVPLDPAAPPARQRALTEDARLAVVITDQAGEHDGTSVIAVERGIGAKPPPRRAGPDDVAYCIYTSGSSGMPKAVEVTHRSVLNLATWQLSQFGDYLDLGTTQLASPIFDAAVLELWPALMRGATVHLAPAALSRDPRALVRWLVTQPVAFSFVPTPLVALLATELRAHPAHVLRAIWTGGDALVLPPDWPREVALFNAYGPTECTVAATAGRVDTGPGAPHRPPIGRPIANTRIYILDPARRPVPVGMAGELWIGGAGVARGYLDRPELTAARFVRDPWSSAADARMYATGDRARWLPSGELAFLGRSDHQIKLRGVRIEPGEIEACLLRHPDVQQAVVVAREDEPGHRYLAAYVTASCDLAVDALRAHAAAALPAALVPAAFVQLAALPVLPSGKLDRRALPAPAPDAHAARPFTAPLGEVETAVAAIWAETLRLARVGRDDDFFALGGHSLHAVTVIEHMAKRGLHADVAALFATPTLAGFAAATRIARDTDARANPLAQPGALPRPELLPLVDLTETELARIADAVPGGVANIQDVYPLAPLQEGILFHHLTAHAGDPYLMATLLRFEHRERLDRFVAALQQVIDRHDLLRTAFVWDGLREPLQVVLRAAALPVEEVALDGAGPLLARFDARGMRIDLRCAPLMQVKVARDGDRWLLLLIDHHLINDGTTLRIILEEIQAILDGAETLPAPRPFRDFIARARAGRPAHEAFFRRVLGDVDQPTLPFGLVDVQGDGTRLEEAHREVDPALAAGVRARARALGVTPASVFHLAWALVLARVADRRDVVFGTVLAGRAHASGRAMGLFINTLPVRIAIGDAAVEASVRQMHATLSELMQHEHAPLALAQRCSGVPAATPLFSSLLNYRHAEGGASHVDGVETLFHEDRTNYPITFTIDESPDGFRLGAQVPASVGADRLCGLVHAALAQLVAALAKAPATPSAALDVLPASERDQLCEGWNATDAEFPDTTLVRLIEAQVARTPDAVALQTDAESLTYAALNARANQLAHHLRGLGVGPDERVAVCVERGAALVISLLAVLKAGGAYVPLDPAYPAERLAYMLADSAPAALLADHALASWPEGVPVVDVAAPLTTADDDLADGAAPHHLAYCIYTSGSTGQPKAVLNEHRGVVNLLWAMRTIAPLAAGERLLAITTITFDIAALELWLPLVCGATIALVSREVAGDAAALAARIAAVQPTVMQATPSTWRMLLDAGWPGAAGLIALCGGEALPADLANALRPRVAALWNVYGPTETTIWSTAHRIGATVTQAVAPIGAPLANTRVYVLDAHGRTAPVGVAGELYIAGAGVARGYWRRPELTAERFATDRFAPTGRMYRTGDVGRWLADGTLEYLGRSDFQVKLRGHRIELGEIEARMRALPYVGDAVVLAREDTAGDPRLVAYATLRAGLVASDLPATQLAHWQAIYDHTYAGADDESLLSFAGWNSSYTGAPIALHEMREWLTTTVDRVRALAPRRVLELGCGAGLLLLSLAPDCERYVGTDFSPAALAQLSRKVTRAGLSQVRLQPGAADDVAALADERFDTVILNSVIQYFPDAGYLRKVIAGAQALLAPGGRLFIGDVRHLRLLPAFHASVQLHRAAADDRAWQIGARARAALESENELVLDPDFFAGLAASIEVMPRLGRHANELTAYRYDVVLHRDALPALPARARDGRGEDLATLRRGLERDTPDALLVRDLDNARLAGDLAIQAALHGDATAAELRARRGTASGVDPQALAELAAALGYHLHLSWLGGDDHGSYHALLIRPALDAGHFDHAALAGAPRERRANDPLRAFLRSHADGDLRRALAAQLPAYMVPAHIVFLDTLPRTANGKLDRKALPAPEQTRDDAGYVAPRTPAERAVAAIWAAVLKLDRVGVHDHFFELGGHSLLVVQVVSRVRQALGVEVAHGALFTHPVLADFARGLVAADASALPAPVAGARGDHEAMSFAQQRLWFLAQLEGASAAYHMGANYELRGTLDVPALRAALDRIVARHEVLRTTYAELDGRPVQRIAPAVAFALCEHDVRGHADPVGERARVLRAEARAPFDLVAGPVIRGRLIRHGNDAHTLLLTCHHIAFDGWSNGVLAGELAVLYAAFARGDADPLPPPAIQYADYAAWQRRTSAAQMDAQAAYWRDALAGAPALLDVPTDRPRPPRQDYAGDYVAFTLDEPTTRGLRALARRHDTTLFTTVLAGWAVLLSRLSGQDDLVIGTPTANRAHRETEGLIGLFANTLALRFDLSGDRTVGALLQQVAQRTLAAQRHQDIPFERVVEAVAPARSLASSPLFQVMFAWLTMPQDALALPGLAVTALGEPPHGTSRFDLTLVLEEADGGLRGGLEYASALFDRATAERYLAYLRTVLVGMLADGATVAQLPLLTDGEAVAALARGVLPPTPVWTGTVHAHVEAQAARTPDAIAVVGRDGAELTYAALDARANRLAHHLRGLGAGPDARVAVCLGRDPAMVVALLAVLKAGAAYVPLDPAYPADRLARMVANAAPIAVISEPALLGAWATGVPHRVLDDAQWRHLPATSLGVDGDLAYVIYTSGSTGTPKGVDMPHGPLVNLLAWQATQADHPQRTLQFAALGFDVAFQEIFSTLTTGGTLVLLDEAARLEPAALWRAVVAQRIERIFLPFVALQVLAEGFAPHDACCLQDVITAGEQLRIEPRIARMFAALPGARLHNHYGPTETHVITAHTLAPDPAHWPALPPIGRPLPNTRTYVLDAQLRPVPVGVTGELYLGGAAVARGYLHDPILTDERFLPDPFFPGARVYRTGDLARWRTDGNLDFLGRNDFQIKIRGFRVELGEIEAVLARHPAVRDAVVLAREDEPGSRRLVAYFTADQDVSADALRAHLAAALPGYMVPAAFVALPALPLTPNGKLDRNALPAPDHAAFAARAFEPPQGPVETTLAHIWADILGVPAVGRRDHFFDLGGHSLLAVRVISRLREALGIEARLVDVFARPVLADFAWGLAAAHAATLPPITAADPGERRTLSFAQQRLWFLAQLEGASAAYHITMGVRLRGTLDEPALRRALDRLVERHEALRTTFAADAPTQHIAAPAPFALVTRVAGEAELAAHVAREARAPFDLVRGPLVRGQLLRLAVDDHALLITMHHIVSDGWSLGVLGHELSALYAAFRAGAPDPLPPPDLHYADYAAWQRRWLDGAALHQQAAYWRTTLAGAPALIDLPTDHPRPAEQRHTGCYLPFVLDRELVHALKALGPRHGVTPFMTLLAAWAILLGRLSGQDDVVIGTPVANRGRRETEGVIGLFVNTLALRLDLADTPTVAELLQRVKASALAAQQHQDLPFEQVVEQVRPVRSLAHTPVFQVLFAWNNNAPAHPALAGLVATPLPWPEDVDIKYDLTLAFDDDGDRLTGGIEWSTALFERATIERYLAHLRTLLAAIARDADQPIDRLPLLSDEDRARVLGYASVAAPAPLATESLVALFAAQRDRTPHAPAVSHGQRTLDYAGLDARARRLAARLGARGAAPGTRVALCVVDGVDAAVAVLAILMTGAAYVPIEHDLPAHRVAALLADSAALAVVADVALSCAIPVVDVADDGDHAPDLRVAIDAATPAYVIYTSGSTGAPKGVVVTHGNVLHAMQARFAIYGAQPPRLLQIAPYSFDISVAGLWWALATGGRVHHLAADDRRDPEAIVRSVQAETITHVMCTASLYERLLAASARLGGMPSLAVVAVGGEAASAELLRRHDEHAPATALWNEYGPTEATVWATAYRHVPGERAMPIGRPIPGARIYVLDAHGAPVPEGVTGELVIGGPGVAAGYLEDELTRARFAPDPFADRGTRMYRTGDRARWRGDGQLELRGRADGQVKLRGHRVELGEIQACLQTYPGVAEAAVLVRGLGSEPRLVAYYTGGPITADALRAHVAARLPAYMVPSAYVALAALPLTRNGKLDTSALPVPEGEAFALRTYEAPRGEVERALAVIWATALGVEAVGRHDNFFELGGHSFLAVVVVEQMRARGLHADVKALFATSSLAELAAAVDGRARTVAVPPNGIPTGCTALTPEMLPLARLSQAQLDGVVRGVPGGAANVQDIYALAPLQEGILFHHLMAVHGDPYLLSTTMAFADRTRLDAYLAAVQGVTDRHDILRTAIAWEGLPEPVQVVWRHAPLRVQELVLDPADGDVAAQLRQRFDPRHHRLDVRRAPMMEVAIAYDAAWGQWVTLTLLHHLVGDHTTQDVLEDELEAHLQGRADRLPPPLPFRTIVAQARLGISAAEHEAFFRAMLGDVDEPTVPFGLVDVQGDGTGIAEAERMVDADVGRRLREHARRLGVSPASLFHLAWAHVLARVSGRSDVVFGTVLFGRMQGGDGADRTMGLYINTLPLRLTLGRSSLEAAVHHTHARLADLMRHEHASLPLAQRCSAVPAPAPLFSALINYRHSAASARDRSPESEAAWSGIAVLAREERTNYPLTLSVDDLGTGFALSALVDAAIEPQLVCALMHTALAQLVAGLECGAPDVLDVLADAERARLARWSSPETPTPVWTGTVHAHVEAQAARTPDAIAVVGRDGAELTYAALDARANRLAHHLRGLGAGPDARVAVCLGRDPAMVVALLAVLKAGAAYVPLDPAYPADRLARMVANAAPIAVISEPALLGAWATGVPHRVLDDAQWRHLPATSLGVDGDLAYVIYTSGSTGTPKGVDMPHGPLVNLLAWQATQADHPQRTLQFAALGFDVAFQEIFSTLTTGGTLVLLDEAARLEPAALWRAVVAQRIERIFLPFVALQVLAEGFAPHDACCLQDVITAGEQLRIEPRIARMFAALPGARLHNHYGPTETHVITAHTLAPDPAHWPALPPIGRPLPNTRTYVLDAQLRPVPVGVTGELYLGGAAVARGYLHDPILTDERFLPDPFFPGARVYRTGDLARWRTDGNLDFLGRNDFQIKIRGFRVELGEIEAVLARHPAVRDAVVLAREDEPGSRRLVAYFTADQDVSADALRAHLAAALPGYMVPAAFVALPALPLTPNGKLDRNALPAPDHAAFAARAFEPPQGPVETTLAHIWADVLGVPAVGRRDHFFDLGGHSLLAIRLVARVQEALGVDLSLRETFAHPVLAELAERVVDAQLAQFDSAELATLLHQIPNSSL
jgi:amino acid adenylation domain-containing protein